MFKSSDCLWSSTFICLNTWVWTVCAASICCGEAQRESLSIFSAHTQSLSLLVSSSLFLVSVSLSLWNPSPPQQRHGAACFPFCGADWRVSGCVIVLQTPRDVSGTHNDFRLCAFSCCRDRKPVRESAVYPQDPAGCPKGDAGGDALPVRLPQPVSIHLYKTGPSHLW